MTERANNFTIEFNTASTDYPEVVDKIKNETWTAVAALNNQIATLKTTISTDIAAATESDVINCLSGQQTAANELSSDAINSTCWVGVTYPDLESARDALGILAQIPNNTIDACASLNPLPSQDQQFVNCISHKILDLDLMNDALVRNFTAVKEQTLNSRTACFAEQTGVLSQQINDINFQVTLCMS